MSDKSHFETPRVWAGSDIPPYEVEALSMLNRTTMDEGSAAQRIRFGLRGPARRIVTYPGPAGPRPLETVTRWGQSFDIGREPTSVCKCFQPSCLHVGAVSGRNPKV